jgi:hypothetical protein
VAGVTSAVGASAGAAIATAVSASVAASVGVAAGSSDAIAYSDESAEPGDGNIGYVVRKKRPKARRRD